MLLKFFTCWNRKYSTVQLPFNIVDTIEPKYLGNTKIASLSLFIYLYDRSTLEYSTTVYTWAMGSSIDFTSVSKTELNRDIILKTIT